MKLLCHRGIWFTPEEKNTERALGLAFAQGLGIVMGSWWSRMTPRSRPLP
jgi:hypothetical protein